MREIPAAIERKLTAAADGFAAMFDDLRMDDIAHATGIPRATLYYHFSGKDDILAFLFNATLGEFRALLFRAAEQPGSARQRLAGLVRAYLQQLAARPAAAQLVLLNLGKAGKLPDIAAGVQDALYAPFELVIADGIAAGELRAVHTRTTATALVGSMSIVGLQSLVTSGGFDAEQVAAELNQTFWSGLAAEGSPARRKT